MIKLLRFNVLYFSHDQLEHSIDNVLVLVTSFKMLGRSTINCKSVINNEDSRLSLKLTADATEGEHTTMENAVGERKIKKSVTVKASTSESVKHCTGLTCSLYGVEFCTCITKFFPIEEIILEDIKSGCHFTSHIDFDNFTNKNKRFLLYWYFSVNFYYVTGKHHRCDLPACLIWAVRGLYPKLLGEKYSDIKSEMIVEKKSRKPRAKKQKLSKASK